MTKIKYFISLYLLVAAFGLTASEKDFGFFIQNNEPYSLFWNRGIDENWALIAYYEGGAKLTTYFKEKPHTDKFQIGLHPDNLPYKQVFEYRPTGKTYESKKFEYAQHENGLKICSFYYDKKFSISGNKFVDIEGSIVERPKNFIDNDLPKSEVRYCLWKKMPS